MYGLIPTTNRINTWARFVPQLTDDVDSLLLVMLLTVIDELPISTRWIMFGKSNGNNIYHMFFKMINIIITVVKTKY